MFTPTKAHLLPAAKKVVRFWPHTEYRVTLNVKQIDAALPNALDSTEKRFTSEYWNPQEFMHGVILNRLGQIVGMPPVEVDTETIQAAIKFAGMLTTYAPSAATAFLHAYYVKGAITELTATSYKVDRVYRELLRYGEQGGKVPGTPGGALNMVE